MTKISPGKFPAIEYYMVHIHIYVSQCLWRLKLRHIYMYNVRHNISPIFQSLVVLEYLIKTGSERVSQQCKDNLFSIQTLKDFQYVDKDGKDQGANSECSRAQLASCLVCLIIGVPKDKIL